MNKKLIRLTESDLHKVIKESVNKVLTELDWKTYDSAMRKAAAKKILIEQVVLEVQVKMHLIVISEHMILFMITIIIETMFHTKQKCAQKIIMIGMENGFHMELKQIVDGIMTV